MSKPSLGRGLSALIQGGGTMPVAHPEPVAEKGEGIQPIEVTRIVPNRYQPRRSFSEKDLADLTDSIRMHGVLQPVIVRRQEDHFELITGERRWRACRQAGLGSIPAIIREASDEQLAELALIENIQREELNPIEQAEAFQKLMDVFGLKQEDVAAKVGKNRATVANTLRLLELHPQVKTWVAMGQISVGHAKAILGLDIKEEQNIAAQKVIKDGLNVRQTEKLVAQLKKGAVSPPRQTLPLPGKTASPAQIRSVEQALQQKLKAKVRIKHGPRRGSIIIEYFGEEDLNRILEELKITV